VNAWLPALFLLVLGALAVLVGLRKLVAGHASASWPTTTATILAAELNQATGVLRYWIADLSFRYAVGGATYRSSRYSAAPSGFWLRRNAARIVEQHRPGSHAVVAYPPSDPGEGVLAPGVGPVVVASLRIIALGLTMLYQAWRFVKGA
jgi:hypothetical protein